MDLTPADYVHTPAGTRQRNLTVGVVYDAEYVRARYGRIPARLWDLAGRRVRVLSAFAPPPARLLDFGCGVGAVVGAARAAGYDAYGHDLAPVSGVPAAPPDAGPWDAVTFFDVLEHLPDPAGVVQALSPTWVMVSVPWCHYPDKPDWFMGWRHRRPGEHLHHWNRATLDAFFAGLGYSPLMHSSFEDQYRPHPDQPEPNVLSAIYRRA